MLRTPGSRWVPVVTLMLASAWPALADPGARAPARPEGSAKPGAAAALYLTAVKEAARRLGLGRLVVELLIQDAVSSGARELFLFTGDAWEFWQKLGFADVPLEDWPEATRASWQYQHVSAHWAKMGSWLHSMRRAV